MINKYFTELENSFENVPPVDPGRQKVIIKRGASYSERYMDSSKTSVSVMMNGSAAGYILLPYVVYKALIGVVRPDNIWRLVFPNCSEIFSTKRWTKSHACREHNIRFILLPPNSTHLCQPLHSLNQLSLLGGMFYMIGSKNTKVVFQRITFQDYWDSWKSETW